MRSTPSPAPEPAGGSADGPDGSGGDAGAAPVEFVGVGALVLALVLAVAQLGFALHVRNTLTAAATDGARVAAAADRDPADGAERAREVIRGALPDRFAADVTAGRTGPANGGAEDDGDGAGAGLVAVEIRADLPLFGPWGLPRRLVVRGHAVDEGSAP